MPRKYKSNNNLTVWEIHRHTTRHHYNTLIPVFTYVQLLERCNTNKQRQLRDNTASSTNLFEDTAEPQPCQSSPWTSVLLPPMAETLELWSHWPRTPIMTVWMQNSMTSWYRISMALEKFAMRSIYNQSTLTGHLWNSLPCRPWSLLMMSHCR